MLPTVRAQSMGGMTGRSRRTFPSENMDFLILGACTSFDPTLPADIAADCDRLETAAAAMKWEDARVMADTLSRRAGQGGLGEFWYGYIEMKRGNPSEGLKHLQAAVEKAPQWPLAHLNLGVAYAVLRRTEELEEQMRWVMVRQPENPWPYYYLGRYYSDQLGRLEEGTGFFLEALKRDSQNYHSRFQVGLNWEMKGDFEKAKSEFEVATATADSKDPAYVYPLLGLARIDWRQQNFAEALRYAQEALFRNPRLAAPHFTLGHFHFQGGELEKAVTELKAAAELDPVDPAPHYILARAYRKMNLLSEARCEEEIFSRLKAQQREDPGR